MLTILLAFVDTIAPEQFTALRFALDTLALCHAAEVAAWRANGEPTDGTRNRLQGALVEATRLASRDVADAASAAGLSPQLRATILDELKHLADGYRIPVTPATHAQVEPPKRFPPVCCPASACARHFARGYMDGHPCGDLDPTDRAKLAEDAGLVLAKHGSKAAGGGWHAPEAKLARGALAALALAAANEERPRALAREWLRSNPEDVQALRDALRAIAGETT